MTARCFAGLLALAAASFSSLPAQEAKPATHLKDEMRMPWARSDERFIRRWLVLSDFPLSDGFDKDWLTERGGESAIHPSEKMVHKMPDGKTYSWRAVTAWGDGTDLSDGPGLKRDMVGYAFATIARKEAGKALLSLGSDESIRAWVNGALVLDKRTRRQLTLDEDQVEVDLKAGDNTLLVKVEQRTGPWVFAARVLERGAVPPRVEEIGPSLMEDSPTLAILTDISKERAGQDKVTVQAVAAGGKILAEKTVTRGETVRFDPGAWPSGAYEIRCATHRPNGLLYATHLPWYKGDAMAAARALVAAAAKADLTTPPGITTKMLGDLVLDRLGKDLDKVTGNPWWAIHSPLMEDEELRLEAAGKAARERPYGFFRLAWHDDIDGSPQFCRAYLPPGYNRAKKWPVVIHIHGYNPTNPDYVRWWSVDSRHNVADIEYAGGQGVIYIEPHGRGNTTYLGLGDQDVVRVVALVKQRFSVDEDRVYLVGDSMGGWGTWNVATRHPGLFAAIAPIYGGADYHSQFSEEELAKLTPVDRFLEDKGSSWSMAEGLLSTPILVHHGDVDKSVNVDFSRYGVRLLQRWGYNVRYVEMPGYGHEELSVMGNVIDWFLEHRRDPNPRHVRIRTAELQNAAAWWAKVDQYSSPREFMVVDAEVIGPNLIRVDSQNVLALTLTPGSALVNAEKPVKVVWNGEPRTLNVERGGLALRATAYQPAPVEKNAEVAGPLGDILNTPFAIVVPTAAADPAMNDICRRKAEAAIEFWKQWQRQPPRVFKDSELSDQDAARYSLLLIGGAEANLVARKLAARLPLEISKEQVKIGGRSFAASDARVQMIVPNPLNPRRYVLLVAATSPEGMYFWSPDRLRNAEFDFTIEDGRMALGKERVPGFEVWVAGGWFDRRWQIDDSLVLPGNAEVRSKAVLVRAPKPGDQKLYRSYTGAYQAGPGMVVKVTLVDGRLLAKPGEQPPLELVPISDTEFVVIEGPVKVVFEKDAAGKVASFKISQGGHDFSAKKIE